MILFFLCQWWTNFDHDWKTHFQYFPYKSTMKTRSIRHSSLTINISTLSIFDKFPEIGHHRFITSFSRKCICSTCKWMITTFFVCLNSRTTRWEKTHTFDWFHAIPCCFRVHHILAIRCLKWDWNRLMQRYATNSFWKMFFYRKMWLQLLYDKVETKLCNRW